MSILGANSVLRERRAMLCAGFKLVERVKHFTDTALGKGDKAPTIVQVNSSVQY